jgi:D-alanyl-D-alanine carboxypeptidase
LNPGEKYGFTFYGSRFGGKKSRTSLYRIGRQTTQLSAHDNRENTASIENVTADQSGSISITIECPEGQKFAYLGVLEVRGQFRTADEATLPPDGLEGQPLVAAKAWAIADGRTGKPLWGWNVNVAKEIASTTKIMTAWIILELASKDPQVFDEIVTISE